jgi:hypothetical protein
MVKFLVSGERMETRTPRRRAAASKMPEAVIEQGRRNRGNAKGSGAISPPASGPGWRAGQVQRLYRISDMERPAAL